MNPLEAARELLGDRVGFRFDETMRRRLARALEHGANAHGSSEARYVESLRDDPAVLQELIDRVSVPETCFFREPQHFAALTTHVLPGLKDDVNVWCAACSTGQEPYSLAMVLTEWGAKRWRVLATDVSTPALDRAAAGSYAARELRGLSDYRRNRHFESTGERRFAVGRQLRAGVAVRRHNLIRDPPPELESFDVVFCRNVLIYMRPRETEALLDTIRTAMKPDGYLFIGAAESLWHLEAGLAPTTLGETYAYRRASVKKAASAPPLPGSKTLRPPAGPAPPPGRAAPRSPAEKSALESLVARGDAAFARNDVAAAIASYREACELAPGSALPHALLGLALEQHGADEAARRAFEAAWGALGHGDPRESEPVLEGFRAEELARLLIGKLRSTA